MLGATSNADAIAPQQFDIPAQSLALSLNDVAKKAGIDLVFDPRLMTGMSAAPLHGRMTVDGALKRLLAFSPLTFSFTTDGAVLIKRRSPATTDIAGSAPANIPEILVTGRRALNVDLVRSEDDIQPYQIMTSRTIGESGAQSLDAVFKSRLPDNAQALLSNQMAVLNNGSPRSQIDLRGLGTAQTLILVDGHRLPSFPELSQFGQSDINGIPLNAIDRIETLPSTAAGIYGPGASGGVVNIILKHDASGFDVSMSRGVSARGDAPNWRIQAHAGFTSPSDDTKVDLFYEHSEDGGLSVGDRSYVQSAATRRFANLNAANLSDNYGGFAYYVQFYAPYSNSINFLSNGPLTLAPQFGGGSIGSNYTFIPFADIGTPREADILRANAGKLDFSLPDTGAGLQQSLLTKTKKDGGVLTLRQRLLNDIDGFLDVTATREVGKAVGGLEYQILDSPALAGPDSPIVDAQSSFPPIANTGRYATTNTLIQATGGLIASLPRGWQVEADVTGGLVTSGSHFPRSQGGSPVPYPDPFAGAAVLQAYEDAIQPWPYIHERSSDRLIDGSLRLAGPLIRLPAGPVSLTILGEMRSDRSGGIHYTSTNGIDFSNSSIESSTGGLLTDSSAQHLADGSIYAELRAPLVAADSDIKPLRGLEFQAALRGDHYHLVVPRAPIGVQTVVGGGDDGDDGDGGDDEDSVGSTLIQKVRESYNMLAFTLGAKIQPMDGVTLRASLATGAQPPDTSYLANPASIQIGFVQGADSKRGNEPITAPLDTAGSGELKPSHYRSLLIGGIVNPSAVPSLRLSIDYTRLSSNHEVFAFPTPDGFQYYDDASFFLDNEDALPGRVVRAPLTAADKAKGYTGGVITSINGAAANSASSRLDALDFNLRYGRGTSIGSFSISSQFDWILDFKRRTAPYEPSYTLVGYLNGPPRWKGNVELDWQNGPVAAGINMQIVAPYRGTASPAIIAGSADMVTVSDVINFLLLQGKSTVPAQAYVDAFVSFHIRASAGRPNLLIRLSCQNVLDKAPPFFTPVATAPFVSDFGLGYSYYGDPRGRRFAIDVTASF